MSSNHFYLYDYYTIDVPYDVGPQDERITIAIREARHRTRLFAVPCEWTATIMDDQQVHVRRKRHKTPNARHYHVTEGMHGGYTPHTNYASRTKAEALTTATWLAEQWRQDTGENDHGKEVPLWIVTGSASALHYEIELRERSDTHLGYYIDIHGCTEPDCLSLDPV